jgi:hypothetical protein
VEDEMMPLATGEITLTAPLIRHTEDGERVELDVTLTVRAALTARGYPDAMPSLSDPGEPGAPNEYEFTALHGELTESPEAGEPYVVPDEWPALRAWLVAHDSDAWQAAEGAGIADRRREEY